MSTGYAFAFGPCFLCGRSFTFDAELVPSVYIDPQTGKPPDVEPIVEGGMERAYRQPLCLDCVTIANAIHERLGQPLIDIPFGAYTPEQARFG